MSLMETMANPSSSADGLQGLMQKMQKELMARMQKAQKELAATGGAQTQILQGLQGARPEDMVQFSKEALSLAGSGASRLSSGTSGLSSGNVMSNNFAGAVELSDEAIAIQKGKAAAQQVAMNSQQTLMSVGRAMLIRNGINPDDVDTASGAKMLMQRRQNKQVSAKSEENLEEIREEIAAKAQEAMAPKDANGNPIHVLTPGAQPGAQTGPAETAPVDTPETASVAAPQVATPDVATPDVAAPVAGDTPSVDIMV